MNFPRHIILLFVILLLASHQKPIIDKEMEVTDFIPSQILSQLRFVCCFLQNFANCAVSKVSSQDLREFYDPDTVDLMQWIEQNSGVREPFVSSKQLSLLLLLLMLMFLLMVGKKTVVGVDVEL